MLSTVLNIIIFEDCRNQWSMSRPLLGLILLNEKVREPAPWCPEPEPWVNTCLAIIFQGTVRNIIGTPHDGETEEKTAHFLSMYCSCLEWHIITELLEVNMCGNSDKG